MDYYENIHQYLIDTHQVVVDNKKCFECGKEIEEKEARGESLTPGEISFKLVQEEHER